MHGRDGVQKAIHQWDIRVVPMFSFRLDQRAVLVLRSQRSLDERMTRLEESDL